MRGGGGEGDRGRRGKMIKVTLCNDDNLYKRRIYIYDVRHFYFFVGM